MATRRKRTGRRGPDDAVRDAAEYGIDISLIRDNLARTPAERMRRHQVALDRVQWLQKARFL